MSRHDAFGNAPTYDQPAAYDVQGRPLYYRSDTPTDTIKPANEEPDILPPDLQQRHDDSVRLYSDLQFSRTEYVVIDVRRTIWGLVLIWLVAVSAFVVILLFSCIMASIAEIEPFTLFILVSCLGLICLIGGALAQYVFRQNYFIVTNERIIARIQTTPFSYRTQNVEIEHVEDCSFRQNGLIQMILNYGTIRLSTIGDEQTYRFTFVTQPSEQFKVINRVVQVVDEDIATKYRD